MADSVPLGASPGVYNISIFEYIHWTSLELHINTNNYYLYCRRQHVNGKRCLLSYNPVMSGVPQGSILGPLLFITYINPVSNLSLSCEAKLTIYADDILLYKPISSVDDFSALQQDIDQVSNCIRSLHLSMNPSKCKYLIASKKRCALDPPTQLLLDGKVLEVSSYRYLALPLSLLEVPHQSNMQ